MATSADKVRDTQGIPIQPFVPCSQNSLKVLDVIIEQLHLCCVEQAQSIVITSQHALQPVHVTRELLLLQSDVARQFRHHEAELFQVLGLGDDFSEFRGEVDVVLRCSALVVRSVVCLLLHFRVR